MRKLYSAPFRQSVFPQWVIMDDTLPLHAAGQQYTQQSPGQANASLVDGNVHRLMEEAATEVWILFPQ